MEAELNGHEDTQAQSLAHSSRLTGVHTQSDKRHRLRDNHTDTVRRKKFNFIILISFSSYQTPCE